MTLQAPLRPSEATQVEQRALSVFLRRTAVTDILVITWAVFGAEVLRFGSNAVEATLPGSAETSVNSEYTAFSIALIVAWVLMLRVHNTYDKRLLGHGPEEYKTIATASFRLFAVVTVISYLLRIDLARGYVAIAMPAGTIGLLLGRWLWRKWLTLHRTQGQLSSSVLVVGDGEHLSGLIRALSSAPEAGYRVVAACCSNAENGYVSGVPVLGSEADAADVAERIGVNTVACTSSDRFDSGGLRRLGWALEGLNVDLVVVPSLTDVAGPRVLTRPVAGLSLLHVEAPVFEGPKLAVKTAIDRISATCLLIVLSPLFAVVAVLIRRDHGGPVFFKQQRVGKGGASFAMLKFRTMVVGAEAQLGSLQNRSEGKGPLFKMRDDPRITAVGAKLRKYSIDEVPQLINVLRGHMSLVGPRPPLASEVETYAHDVRRRLLVKPGMTGLWQINGRSDLSWDESVRFDLYYVENWSVMSDLIILWRTARAVLRSSGAY